MQQWNASNYYADALIVTINTKTAVNLQHVCTSGCLHTGVLFSSQCFAEFTLSWITLYSHWIRINLLLNVGSVSPSLPFPCFLFVWKSWISVRFTHRFMLSPGPRGRFAGGGQGPQGVGVCFFDVVWSKPLLSASSVACGGACRYTTRYWLNNLFVPVMWLTPASCCELHGFHRSLGKVDSLHIRKKSGITLVINQF